MVNALQNPVVNNNSIFSANNTDLSTFISVNSGNARAKLLDEFDRLVINACIRKYGHNQTKMAQVLGMNRGTLRTRLAQLGFIK